MYKASKFTTENKFPTSIEEAVEHEDFFASQYIDNPRFGMLGISKEQLKENLESVRGYELGHKQRVAVYEKETFELVGGYRCHLTSEVPEAEPRVEEVSNVSEKHRHIKMQMLLKHKHRDIASPAAYQGSIYRFFQIENSFSPMGILTVSEYFFEVQEKSIETPTKDGFDLIKLMNEELYSQARLNFPEKFENSASILVTNGVCVSRSCRNKGLLKFIADVGELHAYRLGCDRILTTLAAPESICVTNQKGYETLSRVTYRDKGKPYALSDAEFASRAHIARRFPGGEPIVTLVIKQLKVPTHMLNLADVRLMKL